jgi:transcriptional regulator with XRE-family HTH domain
MTTLERFAMNLRHLRKQNKMNQVQTAKKLHISRSLYSDYENAQRRVYIEFVDTVCAVYGITDRNIILDTEMAA